MLASDAPLEAEASLRIDEVVEPAGQTHLAEPTKGAEAGRKVLYWHDPMYPQQKFDKPGKSPFMSMDLVPVYGDEKAGEAQDKDASS